MVIFCQFIKQFGKPFESLNMVIFWPNGKIFSHSIIT
jgi:hypothetical protein